jgi:ribosomal-protein-alanine N-acetyltransferase
MDLIFETDRLILRPPEDNDVPVFAPLICDSRVARNLGATIPHPYTPDDGYRWVKKMRANCEAGEDYPFGIILKETGEYIGCCAVHHALEFEFGYWMGVLYWWIGYATEAARRVAWFAFVTLHPERLKARYMHDNAASGRVLTKLGFQHTHDLVEFSPVRGQDVLSHHVQLARERFENGKLIS